MADIYLTIRKKINQQLKKGTTMQNSNEIPQSMPQTPTELVECSPGKAFNNPEEYKTVTGKRFRMTKDQKNRFEANEISRQEAFDERYDELLAEYTPTQN